MDTQKIVKDLRATGLTQIELSELVGCSQSLIAQYESGARGERPSLKYGGKLLKLHAARCGNRRKKRNPTPATSPP